MVQAEGKSVPCVWIRASYFFFSFFPEELKCPLAVLGCVCPLAQAHFWGLLSCCFRNAIVFNPRSLLLLLCGHKCLNKRMMRLLEVYNWYLSREVNFLENAPDRRSCHSPTPGARGNTFYVSCPTKSLRNFWWSLSCSINSGVLEKSHWVISLYPLKSFCQWETCKEFSLLQALVQPCCELLEKCHILLLGWEETFHFREGCSVLSICKFKFIWSSFGVGKENTATKNCHEK